MNSYTLKLFLALISLLATHQAVGQEKFNIAAGYGYPELLNLGVRYQMERSQLGLSAGFLPSRYVKYSSLGANYFYHFGGHTNLSSLRPWYIRFGLDYLTVDDQYDKYKYLFFVPRIGKDFNLSPKWVIAADGGVAIVLSRNIDSEEIFFIDRDPNRNIFFTLGFSIYYRL